MTDRYLSSAEARERLGASRDLVEKLIKNGEIEAFKLGDGPTSPYRISEASIDAYITRKMVRPAAS